MYYPFFLARRLSLNNNKGKKSPSVNVAIISTALSVAVMIAAITIVLGFKQQIREKVVGFNGHISLYRIPTEENDNNLLELDETLKRQLDGFNYVKDYSLQVAIPAILKTDEDFKGVYLKALNGKEPVKFMIDNLEEGEVPDFTLEEDKNKILISRIAATQLQLNTGDKIDTYFISDEVRVRKLEVAGIYNSHFDQYDNVLIYGSLPLVSQLGNLKDGEGTYILIYTDDFDNIPYYSALLQNSLNESTLNGESAHFYRTDNVMNQGRGFFSWLSLLDTNVVVIIVLMLIIGAVTLISGMLIIILERKKFIGTMRALGASTSKIRSVFIYIALKIAVFGILIGDAFIIVFLWLQEKYHFLKLDADSYYIDFVPVFLNPWIILAINLGVVVVTYLVLVIPSRFVGKISPVESMERD